VEVEESDDYAPTELELPDTLVIRKAAAAASLLVNDIVDNILYDGATHAVTVTAKSDIVGLGSIAVKYDGSETEPTDAGTYEVMVDVAEGDNYEAAADIALGSFVISDKLPVTVAELDYTVSDVVYDGTPHAVNVAAKSGVEGLGAITVKYNGSETEPTNAGTYEVTVDIAESDSYEAAADLSLGTLIIAKAAATATTSLLEYEMSDSILYDGAAHAVTVTAKSGVVGLGTIAVKYNGSTDAPVAAGRYAVTVDIAEGDNYEAAASLALGELVIYAVESPTAVESQGVAYLLNAYVVRGTLHVTGAVESVRMINVTGTVALSARMTGGQTLSVEHLPAGVYFAVLQGSGASRVVKVVIGL
jgi:hypothetical protein